MGPRGSLSELGASVEEGEGSGGSGDGGGGGRGDVGNNQDIPAGQTKMSPGEARPDELVIETDPNRIPLPDHAFWQ